jgi:tetratricopeptide (TPR) repeat protein
MPFPLFALALVLAAPFPAQKGLDTRRTKQAIIKANTSKAIAEAVGQRIDNFCTVFQGFYDELGLEKKSDNMLSARLFNTYEEYEKQFKRQNPDEDPPLAYFSPSMNAIVLYNDEADVTLRQTLFHESSHQFLNRYTSDAPKWLNEGLSEYFEGWRMSPEGKLVEKRTNLYDLKVLQDCLKSGKYLPPKDLVNFDATQFNDFRKNHPELHPYLHYVTAWGLVYFSLELSSVPEDRERLVGYLRDLNSKGARATFEVDSWIDFEARWKTAILGLEPKPVDMVDHILLAVGLRQNREWKEAAALYQKAYELDPKAPGALYWVGYCYKRLGDYDSAMQWLEKARAAEPENPSVPYLMARIALGFDMNDSKKAKSDPAKALELAEAASKLAGGESPGYLELVARCQAKGGDAASAGKTVKRILKLVEEDADKDYYEKLEKELKGK